MSTVTIRLPEKLSKELDLAAKQEKLNKSDLLRGALQDWLQKRKETAYLERLKAQAVHLQKPWSDEEDDLWTIASNEALDLAEGLRSGEPKIKPFKAKRKARP